MKKIKQLINRIKNTFTLNRYYIGEVEGKDIPTEYDGKPVLIYSKGWIYTA